MKTSVPTADIDYQINIIKFDQDGENGFRKFLPPPGSDRAPTPEQFRQAGDSIKDYFEQNQDRGVTQKEIAKWEFSLNFHAFQMYARCDDKEKMQLFLQSAMNQFYAMGSEDLESLKMEYGPAVQPYLEATLIFLSNVENKKQQLNEKLSEMLRSPIGDYPDLNSNVVFFSGRVYDMAKYPDASYDEIFTHPMKLPPLPNTTDWVPANTPEKVRHYVKEYDQALRLSDASSVQRSALTPLKELHDSLTPKLQQQKSKTDMSLDITTEQMTKSAFGQESNTAKKLKNKG